MAKNSHKSGTRRNKKGLGVKQVKEHLVRLYNARRALKINETCESMLRRSKAKKRT